MDEIHYNLVGNLRHSEEVKNLIVLSKDGAEEFSAPIYMLLYCVLG